MNDNNHNWSGISMYQLIILWWRYLISLNVQWHKYSQWFKFSNWGILDKQENGIVLKGKRKRKRTRIKSGWVRLRSWQLFLFHCTNGFVFVFLKNNNKWRLVTTNNLEELQPLKGEMKYNKERARIKLRMVLGILQSSESFCLFRR